MTCDNLFCLNKIEKKYKRRRSKIKEKRDKGSNEIKDFFFFVLSLYKFPDKMILVDDVVYNLSTIKR